MKLCPYCTAGYHDSLATCPTHGGMLSEIRELKPGLVVHKTYRIIRRLGQGGMGTVYLADHLFMNERRALKFLKEELARDEAFTSRFRHEVRSLRSVRHRNVVDCGDLEPAEDDSLFFSMEFVDGPVLWKFVQDAPKPFDVELGLQITRGIAEGLDAAHAKGMVHRDIKPENILIAPEGNSWVPKIADFGIVATTEGSARTRTGTTMLTMHYAAPEQWRGKPGRELDGRTDLYALGGVLYEMLTGRTPFQADSYENWRDQHLSAAPLPPSQFRPELARWRGLDELVLELLEKDREKRPADVSQFLEFLDRVGYLSTRAESRRVTEGEERRPKRTAPEPEFMADHDVADRENSFSEKSIRGAQGTTGGAAGGPFARRRSATARGIWALGVFLLTVAAVTGVVVVDNLPKDEPAQTQPLSAVGNQGTGVPVPGSSTDSQASPHPENNRETAASVTNTATGKFRRIGVVGDIPEAAEEHKRSPNSPVWQHITIKRSEQPACFDLAKPGITEVYSEVGIDINEALDQHAELRPWVQAPGTETHTMEKRIKAACGDFEVVVILPRKAGAVAPAREVPENSKPTEQPSQDPQ